MVPLLSKNPIEIRNYGGTAKNTAVQALRYAIIAELDAINLYEQLATVISDPDVKKVFLDIAREEKTHVGEFLALLKNLDPETAKEIEAGRKEVEELLEER